MCARANRLGQAQIEFVVLRQGPPGFDTVGQQIEMRGCRCRAAERVSLGERNHDFCGETKIKKSNLI